MELKKAELEVKDFVKRITERREKMKNMPETKKEKERRRNFTKLLSSNFNESRIIVKATYTE